jgi:hypothetical protein
MKFRALLPIIMAAAMIMAIIIGPVSAQNAAYANTGGSRGLTLPYSGSVSTSGNTFQLPTPVREEWEQEESLSRWAGGFCRVLIVVSDKGKASSQA